MDPKISGGKEEFPENEKDASELDSVRVSQVAEPMGLAANGPFDINPEDLEHDPNADVMAGMTVGQTARTVDDERIIQNELGIRNAPTIQEVNENEASDTRLHGNVVDPRAAVIALNRELDNATGESTSGTIFSVTRDLWKALEDEKEKRRRDFMDTLLATDIAKDIAELMADLQEMADEIEDVEDDLDDVLVEANEAIDTLENKMSELDSQYSEMQAQKTTLDEKMAGIDSQLASIDAQIELDPDLKGKTTFTDAEFEALSEEQKELLTQKWSLQRQKDFLQTDINKVNAEMNSNRSMHSFYQQNMDALGSSISEAKTSLAESKTQLADLNAQIQQARNSGAGEDKIKELQDQKAALEEQIAQTKQSVQDLSRRVETSNKIIGFEFSDTANGKYQCYAPDKQVEIIESRSALIEKLTTLYADGDLSGEDLKGLMKYYDDNKEKLSLTEDDLKGFSAIVSGENSGITIDGKSGADAQKYLAGAWEAFEKQKADAQANVAQAETKNVEAAKVATTEVAETTEIIADADKAIGGMVAADGTKYETIYAFMTDHYSVSAYGNKEGILDVMNDPNRYLRDSDHNLVYVSNEDQKMYTLDKNELGEPTQVWLSPEQTAELQRQVVQEGMIPRNYAFDTDRGGVVDHITKTSIGDTINMVMQGGTSAISQASTAVNVPDEFSPFDTWGATFSASQQAASIAKREAAIEDSVAQQKGQETVAVAAANVTARAAEEAREVVTRLEAIQAEAKLRAQQLGETLDEAMVAVQAKYAQEELAAETGGRKENADETIWKENDQLDMKAPDPELVAAAGKIMNQVEGGQIPASRLNEVLASLNLSPEHEAILREAVENDPDVKLIDDLGPNAPTANLANATVGNADIINKLDATAPLATGSNLIQLAAGFVMERLSITPSAKPTADPNGVEPIANTSSFADEFDRVSIEKGYDGEYIWNKPESVLSNIGLPTSIMAKVAALQQGTSTSSSSGSGQQGTNAAPDPSLMMTEDQRRAMLNANMGVNAAGGGGGMAG